MQFQGPSTCIPRRSPLPRRENPVEGVHAGALAARKGEREFTKGYALSHEKIVQYVMAVTPDEEVLDGPIRRDLTAFPEVAVREMLANTMVHQDLLQRGTNPMVEIFSNRIEFSNAGGLLVPEERISRRRA